MLAVDGARGGRRALRNVVVAASAACFTALAIAPAAVAQPLVNDHNRATEMLNEEICGIQVETTVSYVDHTIGRIGRDGFPLFQGSGRTNITYYNPATDLSFDYQVRGSFKDLSATDNGDGTFTLVTQNTGIPEQVTLADGTVAIKDVGRIVFSTVLDYNGTPADTEDDEFVSQEILSISGPHPEAESDFTLFCSTVEDALT